jgi:autotransporter-associated beta strand protein
MRRSIKRTLLAWMAGSGWLVFAGPGAAQTTFTWNNTATDWGAGANWTPAGPPTAADIAQFDPQSGGTSVTNPALNAAQAVLNLVWGNTPQGGNYTLTGNGNTLTFGASGGATVSVIAMTFRGIGTTTIDNTNLTLSSTYPGATGSQPASTFGPVDLGSGTTLRLTNGAQFTLGAQALNLKNATLTLDNSAGGTAPTITTTAQLRLDGGGTVNFLGSAAGSSFSLPQLSGGSGDGFVNLAQPAGSSNTVTFASSSRFGNTVNYYFNATNGTFGGGAGNPSVVFTTAPAVSNGVVVQSATVISPFMIITSTSGGAVSGTFANYTTQLVPATTVPRDSTTLPAAAATENTLFTPSSPTTTLSANVTVNSLVISPTANNQTLDLGTNALLTPGIILSGNRNFTVTGGTLFSAAASGTVPRTLYLVDPSGSLTTSSSFAGGSQNVIKSGPGTLILSGTADQFNFATATTRVSITGGVLQAVIAGASANFGTNNILQLRNGVFEVNSQGAPGSSGSSFTRPVAQGTAGAVNWGSSTGEIGGGGFSAVGGNLTVNLGGAGAALVWETLPTAGFVRDGMPLMFGSPRSDSTVVWQNPLGLDGGTPANYTAREFRVTAGTGGPFDKTQITGVISGSSSTDLLKTGTGVLELTAANTCAGNTLVAGGTLRVSGSNAGTGTVRVWSGGTLGGAGSVAGSVVAYAGGAVTPGNGTAVGNLGVGGSAALNGGSVLNVVASGSGVPATGASQLAITGNLDLSDAGTRTIAIFSDGSLATTGATSYTYTIATMAGTTGTFNPANFNVVAGNFGGFVGSPTVTDPGNRLVVTFQPVPEPATVLLACAAGAAVAGGVRRGRFHRR